MFSDSVTINHPVHIVSRDKQMSPSALIPFCEFGGSMSLVGVKIDNFRIPVCNSFQAKILNDQLCYEVDLKKFSDANHVQEELKIGFSFLLDYNEDRQVILNRDPSWLDFYRDGKWLNFGLVSGFEESDENSQAYIYLDTIGKKI